MAPSQYECVARRKDQLQRCLYREFKEAHRRAVRRDVSRAMASILPWWGLFTGVFVIFGSRK